MPDVSPIQLIIVMIIALVVLGPKRLPEMGKSLGKGIREFKQSVSGDEEPKLPAVIPAQTAEPLPTADLMQTPASPRPVEHAVTQQ
jgi:sec-independent protein translocase protein TatA